MLLVGRKFVGSYKLLGAFSFFFLFSFLFFFFFYFFYCLHCLIKIFREGWAGIVLYFIVRKIRTGIEMPAGTLISEKRIVWETP